MHIGPSVHENTMHECLICLPCPLTGPFHLVLPLP